MTDAEIEALIAGVQTMDELQKTAGSFEIDLLREPEFVAELLQTRFVHDVLTAMARLGWTRAELARRMGKKPQYVSRVLRHESPSNFTIATMAEFACALDFDLALQVVKPRRREDARNPGFAWEFPDVASEHGAAIISFSPRPVARDRTMRLRNPEIYREDDSPELDGESGVSDVQDAAA